MPLSQWNLEWLNHNAVRKYPLTDESTCKDTSGSFQLPQEFLVELDLPVHAAMDMEPGKFFIRLIGAYPTGYSITVSYDGSDGYVDVATALIPTQGHARNTTYALGGVEPFDDTMGKVVIGHLEDIAEQPAGLWQFTPDAARIEPDCIRPIIRGVQALIVVDGSQRSQRIVGDVELIAGDNMQIIPILEEGSNPKLRFNAISGEGLIQQCVCQGEEQDAPCIQRINGVTPTADGKLNFIGDQCLQITPTTNGLVFEDKCSAPCCGCPELEAITRDLERYYQQQSNLEAFVGQLEVSANTLELIVLGTRLGDRGCITCQ